MSRPVKTRLMAATAIVAMAAETEQTSHMMMLRSRGVSLWLLSASRSSEVKLGASPPGERLNSVRHRGQAATLSTSSTPHFGQ